MQDVKRSRMNPIESKVQRLWCDLLEQSDISLHTPFDQISDGASPQPLLALIAERFQVRVNDAFVTTHPTIAAQAKALMAKIMKRGKSSTRSDAPPLQHAPRDQPLPLSFTQQRLWFFASSGIGEASAFLSHGELLKGPLDLNAVRRANQLLYQRHEALRTRFPDASFEPHQVIDSPDAAPLTFVDLTALSIQDVRDRSLQLAKAFGHRRRNIATDRLFGCLIVRTRPDRHLFVVAMHHIISDGWSLTLWLREFWQSYYAFKHGAQPQLPTITYQYADFAAWQRAWFQAPIMQKRLAFWTEHLDAQAPPLPTDRPRLENANPKADTIGRELPLEMVNALLARVAEDQLTLYIMARAAVDMAIHAYTGWEDVTVCAPIAGRIRSEFEQVIGFFANTVMQRDRLFDEHGAIGLDDLLQQVRRNHLAVHQNQELPLDKIIEALNPPRIQGQPITQVMLTFHEIHAVAPPSEQLEREELSLQPGDAVYDLVFNFVKRDMEVALSITYRTDLFHSATVERILTHYINAITWIAERRTDPVSALVAEVKPIKPEAPALDASEQDPYAARQLVPIAEERLVTYIRDGLRGLPIGVCYTGQRTYILDEGLNPMPVGVPGELFLGGEALSRGYFGRAGTTAEKFVPNPFAEFPGDRLYRTGDLAIYLPNGDVEFIGRNDNQIKIRGFRIELGEIETVVDAYPDIAKAFVCAREDHGDKYLAAYVVAKPDTNLKLDALRAYLQEKLPDYMVPAGIVCMDQFPLTPNDKVDLKALPEPDLGGVDDDVDFVAPADSLELQMAQIWAEVLNLGRVSVDANFFDIGGHSMLSIKLMGRLQQELGLQMPVAALFQAPTIAGLAALARTQGGADSGPLVTIKATGDQAPLFLIHAIGGGVMSYAPLARFWPEDRPLYGLQSPGLDSGEPLQSIEAMAEAYLGEIRKRQPSGPIYLGAWSMGGAVAYEMAKRDDVAHLIFLDAWAPFSEYLGSEYSDRGLFVSFAQDLAGQSGRPVQLDAATFESLPDLEARIAALYDVVKTAGAVPDTTTPEQFRRRYRVFEANAKAYNTYKLQPQDVAITLFQSESRQKPDKRPRALGWDRLSKQVEVVGATGDHFHMLARYAEPLVTGILGKLD